MKLMLLVIIILVILCTILYFAISKLYDYLSHKEDKYNIHKRKKRLSRKDKLKIEELKATIEMKEHYKKVLGSSMKYLARSLEVSDEIDELHKLIKEIEEKHKWVNQD